jgi:hypothetical protein
MTKAVCLSNVIFENKNKLSTIIMSFFENENSIYEKLKFFFFEIDLTKLIFTINEYQRKQRMAQKDGELLETDKSKPKTTKAEEWDSLYDDSGECVKILENVCVIFSIIFSFNFYIF